MKNDVHKLKGLENLVLFGGKGRKRRAPMARARVSIKHANHGGHRLAIVIQSKTISNGGGLVRFVRERQDSGNRIETAIIGRGGTGRRFTGSVVMVMAFWGGLGRLGGLKRVLQTGKGLLCIREISGLQGGGQILVIPVRLAVPAKWLVRGGLRRGR